MIHPDQKLWIRIIRAMYLSGSDKKEDSFAGFIRGGKSSVRGGKNIAALPRTGVAGAPSRGGLAAALPRTDVAGAPSRGGNPSKKLASQGKREYFANLIFSYFS